MININIQNKDNVISPIIKIGKEDKYQVNDLAYILYMLETGVFAPKFRELLKRQLSPEEFEQISTTVDSLNMIRSMSKVKTDIKSKIDNALTPIVPNIVSATPRKKK